MNFYKLLIPLITLPTFTGAGTFNSITNFTPVNEQHNSLHDNSVTTLSDYPEGGHQFPESEKNNLIFNYTKTWKHVQNMEFNNEKVTISTIEDSDKPIKYTYFSPTTEHGWYANPHFDFVKRDWYDFVNNRKPDYTNYFLIKFGLDHQSRKYIDFFAYAYNRNGDPHYHGNATVIKDPISSNSVFMRLDQLESAKINDEGNGFGSNGHSTGVSWHRFKYFPSQDTVFEVRGLDRLPLQNFYNSNRVYSSNQINNIFQLNRFNQQETKVHINLDLDTQYTWTQPLLYVSQWGYHSDFVNIGWAYDGNDDLVRRKSETNNIKVSSKEALIKFFNNYKVSNTTEFDNITDWDNLTININYKSVFLSTRETNNAQWSSWELESSIITDNDQIKHKVENNKWTNVGINDWNHFISTYKVTNSQELIDNLPKHIDSLNWYRYSSVNIDDLKIEINYQSTFNSISQHSTNTWSPWEIESSIITDYTFESRIFLPNHDWKSEGWTLKTLNCPFTSVYTSFRDSKFSIYNNKDYSYQVYLAGEDWAQENISRFKKNLHNNFTGEFYQFFYLEKTDWLGYKYFIPVTFAVSPYAGEIHN